jgi:hypothetical protein
MGNFSKYASAAVVVSLVCVAFTAEGKAERKKGIAEWEYPGAKKLSGHSGGVQTALYVTGDGLDKVLKHFGDKLGRHLKDTTPTGGGAEGKAGKATASFNDSFGPYDGKSKRYPPRAVRLHIACQHTKAYTVTLVISRVKGEGHTHVAVTYVGK